LDFIALAETLAVVPHDAHNREFIDWLRDDLWQLALSEHIHHDRGVIRTQEIDMMRKIREVLRERFGDTISESLTEQEA
jgi:hypothetical protein